jgi:uncharacterized protein (TIGR02246 family)
MIANTPKQVFELWCEAFGRADKDALAELFEEGAILLEPPGERILRGRHVIAETAAKFAKFSKITVHRVDVLAIEDLAIIYATRTHKVTMPGKEPFEISGTTTDVVRRQPDGRWLMAIDNPNGTMATSPKGLGEDQPGQ